MYWEGGRKHLTILLGNKDNVATMQPHQGTVDTTNSVTACLLTTNTTRS
jgi:hypothetical protein